MNAKLYRLAWQLLKSQWRQTDLRLLFVSLFLSISVIVSVSALTERLQALLINQSSQFIAADRLLKSSQPVDEAFLASIKKQSSANAWYMTFQSMLYAGNHMQIVQVKAASVNYPLRGQLKIIKNGQLESVRQAPTPGTLWVEKRLLSLLDLKLGDTVAIGDANFILQAELVSEPDASMSLFSLGPKILMNQQDIQKTGVVQLGSKVSYGYLFNVKAEHLAALDKQVQAKLKDNQKWQTVRSSQSRVATALERAEAFFKLSASIVIILASVAVAVNCMRFLEHQQRLVALLKTFGLSAKQTQQLFLYVFVFLTLLAFLSASGLAYFVQEQIIALASQKLQVQAPALSAKPFVIAAISSVVSLLAFILPELLRLKNVSALSLFRQEKNVSYQASLASIVLALLCLWGLLVLFTGQWLLSSLLIIGLLLLLLSIAGATLWLLRKMQTRSRDLSHWVSLAFYQLKKRVWLNAMHIAILSMSFSLLLAVGVLQAHVLKQWQNQMPVDAPNYFLINLYQDQAADIKTFLKANGVADEVIYPIVRGRLVAINQENLADKLGDKALKEAGVDRELNLSWSQTLPVENRLLEGQYGKAGVSVEQALAKRLGIKLGDTLQFLINTQTLEVPVTSIRKVNWETMRPNFFMLLDQPRLEAFDKTYITSIYLAEEKKPLTVQINKRWPNVVLIDVDVLLKQVHSVTTQVAKALQVVFVFVLLAALLLFVSSLQHSINKRLKENTLLRVLGANQALLQKSLLAEFCIMGILAGFLACVFAQICLFVLQQWVFDLPLNFLYGMWLLTPMISGLLLAVIGYFAAAKVTKTAPMSLLRKL